MNSGGIRIGKLSLRLRGVTPHAAGDVARTMLSGPAGGTEVPRRLKSAPRGAGFILPRVLDRTLTREQCRREER